MVDTVNCLSCIIEHNVLRCQHLYWNLTSNPCRYKLSNTCLSIIMTDSEWEDYCKNLEHFCLSHFECTFIKEQRNERQNIPQLSYGVLCAMTKLSNVLRELERDKEEKYKKCTTLCDTQEVSPCVRPHTSKHTFHLLTNERTWHIEDLKVLLCEATRFISTKSSRYYN